MLTDTESPIVHGRFRSLLAEEPKLNDPYDRILMQLHGCVVSPTLGSLIANWLLIIPKIPIVNFASFEMASGLPGSRIVGDFLNQIGVHRDRAIWFEHGPEAYGSIVGCGVDQAHLHVLIDAPFTFNDFADLAVKRSSVDWSVVHQDAPYLHISGGKSYLICGNGSKAMCALDVETVGSQFFRRVIAELIGTPDKWNYRTHPGIENVQKTIANFHTLSSCN